MRRATQRHVVATESARAATNAMRRATQRQRSSHGADDVAVRDCRSRHGVATESESASAYCSASRRAVVACARDVEVRRKLAEREQAERERDKRERDKRERAEQERAKTMR